MSNRYLLLAAGLAFVGACTDAPLAPTTRQATVNATTANGIWEETILGETGPGSLYALYKPYGWNREVVYYAHGFNDVAAPVQIPTTQDNAAAIRDALGAMGYAVAMSSFSSNGYDYLDGSRRMHQLRGLVASKFGVPTRNWLAGHSLGAQISQGLVEQHPNQYDGALLMCGVLGGSREHFRWLGDVRVLFDFFYPGVLPGDVTEVPPISDVMAEIVNPAMVAMMTDSRVPKGVEIMTAILQTKLYFYQPSEIGQALVTQLAWHARGINDVTARAQGHQAYFNEGITYTSPVPSLATFMTYLNNTIARYPSPKDAQNWLDRSYEPTGRLTIPVLTIHTTRDQSVPFWHETIYGSLVAAQGASDFLVQRPISRFGHCSFTDNEMLTAFTQLVDWAKNGNKPTP